MLSRKEVLEGTAVVFVEGCVDEGVKKGVGVAKPKENAFPDGRDVTGAEGTDELRDEEGDPAEHEHPNENAHHESRSLILLFSPRVPFSLEGNRGMADSECHLGLLGGILHL